MAPATLLPTTAHQPPVDSDQVDAVEMSMPHPGENTTSHVDDDGHAPKDPLSSNNPSPATLAAPRPIAICGIALRLPGQVRDPEAFWDVLANQRDLRGPIPPDRYNAEGYTNKLGSRSAIKTRHGYFLDEDLTALDTSFFSMSKTELERCDPQQRQLLEVTREVLESAGEKEFRGKPIGCYVGTFGEDWLQMSAKEQQHFGGYLMTGHGDLMLANRLSFEYDFKGPSMVIKTGCSASLICLHEACRALQSGDCTGAIIAGANLIMGPTTTSAMTEEGMLSPEGSCKTFDSAADGYARGEAINAVYIKLLDDAIRDNNPIRAIIRNTGTNSDGKSQGLLTPNSSAHEALMRKVYADIDLDPGRTAFVECHGTGTPMGDPLETIAVGNVFGEHGVYIGSVKPNVGHSEGASGLTSLIKGVLALEKHTIPPNIKFSKPNPKIPFEAKKLKVPIKPEEWPAGRDRRVSINSFGIGGSNAHVILEAPPTTFTNGSAQHETSGRPKLLIASANTSGSLKQQMVNIQAYLAQKPDVAADLAFTLARHREYLPHRAFMVVNPDGSVAEASPGARAPVSTPDIVMVFSGQGAQWPEMGRQLFESDDGFRKDMLDMNGILKSLLHPPSWNLQDELFAAPAQSQIHKAELAQPLCTALQIALVRLLERAGIRPSGVVGHSSGEIAAAYAAGALSLSEALFTAYYRGYTTKLQTRAGGMGAVGLGIAEVSEYLQDGVVVACDNSPSSVTLSGDVDVLDRVLGEIKADKPDTFTRRLNVNMAYHSAHMKPLATQYEHLLETELARKGLKRPDTIGIPLFSSVTTKVVTSGQSLGPGYWISNLTSTVRFTAAVRQALSNNPESLFVEIGPHSTLSGPLRQISAAAGTDRRYVPTLIRGGDSACNVLSAFGQLYQNGVFLDWSSIMSRGKVLTDAPRYAWDHSSGSFWYEARISRESRFREFGHHRLLGLRIPESSSLEPAWRNNLTLVDEPWLADHKIRSDVVFPFAGYIAMAGEAVRQVTGVGEGYRVRHAIARSAMVLGDQPVEIVTTLRPVKLSDSAISTWFEFCIVSHNGSSWTRHCEGRVKACSEALDPSPRPNADTLVRSVPSHSWYHTMDNIGVVYGPEFRGLEDIVSSATDHVVTAKIAAESRHGDSAFLFHPASIDNCLQLLLVSMVKGVGRNFGKLRIPTVIEDLFVRRSAPVMNAVAQGRVSDCLAVEVIADGMVTLRLNGLQLTPVDDGSDQHHEPEAAARLEWLPDFDMVDHRTLFSPPRSIPEETQMQEEMTLLCILETADRVATLKASSWHFEKFRTWLGIEIERAKQGTYPVLEQGSKAYVDLPSSTRQAMIEERYKNLLHISSKGSVAIGIKRILDNCEAIFTGEADTLDILMRDDVLTEIYNAVSFGKGDFFKLLAHSRPDLRILEVGAGTGGTTEMILRTLLRPDGMPAYSVYTFSDISAGFFPQARDRFSYAPNMDYRVFDISQDPLEQGFQTNTYDVILAPNVIHATESLNTTLSNLRPLLRPGGLLVLTELCAVVRTPNYIFGNFSGWWLGEADGRPWEPYVTVDRWDAELKEAGFSGVDTAVRDAEEPFHYCAAIVSTKVQGGETHKSTATTCEVSVITNEPDGVLAKNVTAELNKSNISTRMYRPCDTSTLPCDKDILFLVDLESFFFENISPEDLEVFQNILKNHQSGRILWLTKPAQVNCKDPRSAQVIGVARSIRAETQLPFYTLEIQPTEPCLPELVHQVLDKIQRVMDDEMLAPDKEYIVDEGVVKIGRYQPFLVRKELQEINLPTTADEGNNVTALHTSKPGALEQLEWVNQDLPELRVDEVAIDVRAVGLNFKDILYAMGALKPEDCHDVPLGLEISGVVSSVGSRVTGLAAGDRVMATPPTPCFKTQVACPSELVQKIPDDLSFDEAATMPICYTTVIESLINIGQLERNQSVLIHSAAGGVGHAAIQICKDIGAEIFATVGSQAKIDHLANTFGIPKDHIFNSRDDSFASGLKRQTGSRGVDIVLNSLSGELLHASWGCVAEFGTMIELGKRDIVDGGHLAMRNFLKNRSYCCVDMTHLAQMRPQRAGAALKKCIELYEARRIRSLSPCTIFEATDVQNAFRTVQDPNHIGKVVVKMPTNPSALVTSPRTTELRLRRNACYLLTGGMGGLGVPISRWLVERGAKSLVFLSRSAGRRAEDQAFIRELETCGCSVITVAGRAEVIQDVQRAISLAPYPIRGVIHLAMVLRDAPMATMTHEEWQAANAPKVQGAWNLHDNFKSHELDFFVMASSMVTIVEQPGQGNYSAANTFLEAFTQYRRSLSLPASILNICPIDGVGFVAENPFALKNMKAQGLYFLRELELLRFLELAIKLSPAAGHTTSHQPSMPLRAVDADHSGYLSHQHPWSSTGQVVMGLRSEGDLNDSNTRTNWRRDRRMGFYHNSRDTDSREQTGSSGELVAFLADAADNLSILDDAESVNFLAKEIGNKVFSLMLKDAQDLDVSLTLQQIGLDSLMAIELRRWWKFALGLEMSVLELMATGALDQLGAIAARGLKERFTVAS
ncbi:hypothetical protein FALCPG4_018080 [Fusarium falciforme]